jgi:hypothetical protein
MAVQTSGEQTIIIEMPGETGEQTAPDPANPQNENRPPENPASGSTGNAVALSTAIQAAKQVGTQALNAVVSNIGLATGNTYAQQKIQNTIQGVQTVAALAMSATNWVTFAVTAASMAISAGAEAFQQYKQREIENYSAAQVARRLGYSNARR